jgi:hypothetical protein
MAADAGEDSRTPMAPAHLRVRRALRRTRCSCGLWWPCPDRERDERPIPDGDAVPPPGRAGR